ncbi:hypothetical protein J6590_039519 [Homalodisca vitripennis]|nr:hypothetical protein J6590_039519 [Homalodisca vitripennis]
MGQQYGVVSPFTFDPEDFPSLQRVTVFGSYIIIAASDSSPIAPKRNSAEPGPRYALRGIVIDLEVVILIPRQVPTPPLSSHCHPTPANPDSGIVRDRSSTGCYIRLPPSSSSWRPSPVASLTSSVNAGTNEVSAIFRVMSCQFTLWVLPFSVTIDKG